MCGQLSMIGAVAVIVMIPTALFAQVGGAINPGVHVGALLTPALPFAVPSFGVSLAWISGLGARRVRIITVATIGIVRPPQCRADDGADCNGQTSLLVGYRMDRTSARIVGIGLFRSSPVFCLPY
jgi:hypothetical protein